MHQLELALIRGLIKFCGVKFGQMVGQNATIIIQFKDKFSKFADLVYFDLESSTV